MEFLSHFSAASVGVHPFGVILCDLVLAVFLATCAYTDGTRAKIYNKVTFPTMLVGLVLNGVFGGVSGLLWSLMGLVVGLAIQWVPMMLGVAKAGDVKLLGGVGALKGWAFCTFGFFYGALAFGLFTLPLLFQQKELAGVGQNIKNYFALALITRSAPDAPRPTVTKKFVPWGVGLSAGFFVALGLELLFGVPFWFALGVGGY